MLDPDAILPGGDNAEASPKTVLEMLREKHPPASPIHPPGCTFGFRPGASHPVIIEKLCGDSIEHAALHCQGAAGPSGMDAAGWRMCTKVPLHIVIITSSNQFGAKRNGCS